jgi:glycosyltransferase involved in cell wall biosynthesis
LGVVGRAKSRESASGRSRSVQAGSAASPLVSVIVPAWNAKKTLAETLASVAAQTYRNIEIVIVDDGSTDSTADIAREFCRSESRARLISKENGGVAWARNQGIAESRGEWIAPIDSDDLWHQTRLEKMVAAALSAPDKPGFVYCWCRHIDAGGRIKGSGPPWVVDGRGFRQLAYMNAVGNGSSLLASRHALFAIGGYDASLRAERAQGAEDMLVQIRIAREHPVVCVPEYLVGWRVAGGSMSSDLEQMDRSCRLVYRRLAEDGSPVHGSIARGMIASSALELAEHYAARHNVARAAYWLTRSLRLDPLRTGLFLGYRMTRSARRRLGPARAAPDFPRFLDADPGVSMDGDPYRLARFAELLRTVDARRLRRFAKEDSRS